MGGLFSSPKIPKPPTIEPPPRLPVETDPDLEKRAKMRKMAQRKGRRSTLLSERSKDTNQITKENLGGASGNNFGGDRG